MSTLLSLVPVNESTNFLPSPSPSVPATVPVVKVPSVIVPSSPEARKEVAEKTVKNTSSAGTSDAIFNALFGIAGGALSNTYRNLFPVIAFRADGSPVGYFLSPTLASGRAQASMAKRNGFIEAVVMSPLSTGYTFDVLASGDWQKYVEYIPAPKVNGRKVAKFLPSMKKG